MTIKNDEMKIELQRKGSFMFAKFSGRIRSTDSAELERVFQVNLSEITELILDFKDVTYISSAGLRIIMSADKILRNQGGSMSISNVSKDVRAIFEMTGFDELLNLE